MAIALIDWSRVTAWWRVPTIILLPVLSALLLVSIYVWLFVVPVKVAFSYAGPTCVNRLVVAPNHQKSSHSHYQILPAETMTVMGRALWATKVCFTPTEAPQPGNLALSISPFGNLVAQQSYSLVVPELPVVSMEPLSLPIPITKPLELGLSAADATFSYELAANLRSTDCDVKQLVLACDLKPLELNQGERYAFVVSRHFNDKPIAKVASQETDTLMAAEVTSTSILPNQVVYDTPREVVVYFNKPIRKSEIRLAKADDENSLIEVTTTIEGAKATVSFAELPREMLFRLEVKQVEAEDNSTLAAVHTLTFSTSGGPKVAGVSIGKSGVALGGGVTITFDQPLDGGQSLEGMVLVNGSAVSAQRRGAQVSLAIPVRERCADFTIEVKAGLLSAHQIVSTKGWSQASRTVCHTTEVVGYSVKGRTITSYVFGNGGTTMLYVGALHGNEVGTKYLMDAWIDELEARAKELPAGRQVVVIPVANPDGFAAGSRWNANGVDLNRNWDTTDWQTNVTDTQNRPLPGAGGSEPMSEPETKALAAYTAKLQPRLSLFYHNQAGVVSSNQVGDANAATVRYAALSGYRNATGQETSTFQYHLSGEYEDWMAEKMGLPTILIELATRTNAEWSRNKAVMWEMLSR